MGTDKPLGEVLSDLSEKSRVQTDIPRWDYLMTQMRVITTYIRLIFLPVNQNLDYDYPVYRSLFDPPVLMSFLFLVGIAGFGVYMLYVSRVRGKGKAQSTEGRSGEGPLPSTSHLPHGAFNLMPFYRLAGFGILWFFLALMVESSVIPIADVIFEHRLYLPSVGFFMALSTGAYVIRRRWLKTDRVVLAACTVIVIALSAATLARNTIWQDDMIFWEDVVSKSPNKARGHNNLGYIYIYDNMMDNAIHHLQTAVRLRPLYPEAHNNLGIAYKSQGMTEKAIKHYRLALMMKPEFPEAINNLGIAYKSQGMLKEAIEQYQIAARLNPASAEIRFNLGVSYIDYGSLEKARREFKQALIIKPDYREARLFLNYVNKALSRKKAAKTPDN
jgi:tetratricopeptide (TPR) repeat protein